MPTRVLLLINRQAKQGADAYDLVAGELARHGLEIVADQQPGERVCQAIRRHAADVDLVVVGGGDGTLNDAVQAIVETRLPLGIVPLGTANDLARTLGIPLEPLAACQVILAGRMKAIDLGVANGRYFFNVASIGMSVMITEQLNPELKKRWGVWAYFWTAIQVALRARLFRAVIHTEQETLEVKTVQIAVGNGRYYGGGMTVAEGATIDDQQLDLYSLEVRHWWQIFWLMPLMLHGTLHTSPWVRMLHGQQFDIVTYRPKKVNTDGELTTFTPVQFRLLPQAVRVLAP